MSAELSDGSLKRLAELMDDLIAGKEHDRRTVADRFNVRVATADRYLRAVKCVRGVFARKKGRRTVYKFDRSRLGTPTGPAVTAAACLGSSMWRLFQQSAYGKKMRDSVEAILLLNQNPRRFSDVERKFVYVAGGGEVDLANKDVLLDTIIDAVLDSQPLRVNYRKFKGSEDNQTITIHPLSLAVYHQNLYVMARLPGASLIHPYRFARIAKARPTGKAFRYPDVVEYDPDQLFSESFGIFVDAKDYRLENIRIRLAPRWRNFVMAHRWHRSQRVVSVEPNLEIEFTMRVCPEVEAWLLGFGEEIEVLEPSWVREKFEAHVMSMAARLRPTAHPAGRPSRA